MTTNEKCTSFKGTHLPKRGRPNWISSMGSSHWKRTEEKAEKNVTKQEKMKDVTKNVTKQNKTNGTRTLSENNKGGKISLSFFEASITFTSKPAKDIT